MQKLGIGAAIFACLAACGCAASPMEARQKYEQATADYNACLVANQNNLEACKGKRITMQNASSDNDDAICRSHGLQYGDRAYIQCRENIGD
jgi:outer membrane murein-binding lipoprotein Lpp